MRSDAGGNMEVTFLGTGTSQGVPINGCNCIVCSSANKKDKRLRASIHIKHHEKSIVIDSGPDFRYQMMRENINSLDALIITHEHRDHIGGLDDIRPFNFIQNQAIPVYATYRVQESIRRAFDYIFHEKKYPGIPQLNFETIHDNQFKIGDLTFLPVEVMHYRMPVLGYRFNDFTYITDANFISEENKEKIKGSRFLVLNALRLEPHISHFTLDEAVAMAEELGCEQTYFTHMSHQIGLHDEINKKLPANIQLAFDGLKIKV